MNYEIEKTPGQRKCCRGFLCSFLTLCYFDTDQNCAAILGMKYFGEHKKGTLTMAWALANRNGYASCHGGQKEYSLEGGKKFVASVYGLSGSGKSTLTHAKHNGKYDAFGGIKVLHDDAFIINTDTCASVALEPTYFDKTADYPTGCPDNKFLLTAQNCSATLDEEGHVQLVTEDIRNGNGRAIKSKLWSPNRVDKIDAPVNAIFWIMKDPTIPPVVKLKGSALASVMGATLATKTSTAERVAAGTDMNALRIAPSEDTPSSVSAYDSLQAWAESDEAALAAEATNEIIASTGLTVKFAADGNTLVYEYYASDSLGLDSQSPEELATAFEPVVDQYRSSISSLFDEFESNFGFNLDGIRFVFYSEDGSKELFSSEIPNE